MIALHCRELQGTLLCVGIMSHMAIQVILNIAVVTNTIPNTGITLLYQLRRTSVLFLLAEMGIVLSVPTRSEWKSKKTCTEGHVLAYALTEGCFCRRHTYQEVSHCLSFRFAALNR